LALKKPEKSKYAEHYKYEGHDLCEPDSVTINVKYITVGEVERQIRNKEKIE
jgi:hypothetical protein